MQAQTIDPLTTAFAVHLVVKTAVHNECEIRDICDRCVIVFVSIVPLSVTNREQLWHQSIEINVIVVDGFFGTVVILTHFLVLAFLGSDAVIAICSVTGCIDTGVFLLELFVDLIDNLTQERENAQERIRVSTIFAQLAFKFLWVDLFEGGFNVFEFRVVNGRAK